jgi:hypothetical protein
MADSFPPTSDFLSLIAAQRVDEGDGRYALIPTGEILYLFLGSALAQGLITAAWSRRPLFRPDRVYVRTRKGVFVTHFRSLVELRGHLDPRLFTHVHQSMLVNLKKIAGIDLGSRVKQIDVTLADGSSESLNVSRRYLLSLKARLGLPVRASSGEKAPSLGAGSGVTERERLRAARAPGVAAEDEPSGDGDTRRAAR